MTNKLKFVAIVAVSVAWATNALAQLDEALVVDELNQAIDNAVVRKDLEFLEKHYADGFVFTHGTGHIDSKESWIDNIRRMGETQFLSRQHDSTFVELHGDIAIIAGKLSVKRESGGKVSGYGIRYVRVYAKRDDGWQMISHRTTDEWH